MTAVSSLDSRWDSPAPAPPSGQAPAFGECHIWATRRDDNYEQWQALLQARDLAQATRTRDRVVRQTLVTSRGLQRLVGAHYLQVRTVDVAVGRTCRDCGSPEHGRPHWIGAEEIDYAIAHSGDWVVLAVVRHGRVGVDIERRQPVSDLDALALTVCTAAELAEYRALPMPARLDWFHWLWVRKEAVLKLSGEGITVGPDAVDVRGTLVQSSPVVETLPPGPLHLLDVPCEPGYAAALASTAAVDRLLTYQVHRVPAG